MALHKVLVAHLLKYSVLFQHYTFRNYLLKGNKGVCETTGEQRNSLEGGA